MKIRFWGTRGSIAKAGPGTVRYGGNTSCVEVLTASGTLIVLDCGTGAHGLGKALTDPDDPPRRGHLLISHTHWDHIQGLPFFEPLRVAGNHWDIYAPRGLSESLRETLAAQMQYTYFPVSLDELGAEIEYHELVEGSLEIEDVRVEARYLNHPALTLGYRLEADGATMVYACDHEPHSRAFAVGEGEMGEQDGRHVGFLRGADLVIHDAQFTSSEYPERIGWGHSTSQYAMEVCRAAGAKRLALTHHDPLRDDQALDRLMEDLSKHPAVVEGGLEVFAAAEGGELVLKSDAGQSTSASLARHTARTPVTPALYDHALLLGAADSAAVDVMLEAAAVEGIRAVRARDPEAVMRALEAQRFSLAVLTERVGDRDAEDVCRAIRARGDGARDLPVIVLAEKEHTGGGAEELVSDWLLIPFSLEYARTRLRAWVFRTTCRWIRARIPEDEEKRLASLHRLKILDTAPEERFDRITRIAAAALDVPVALVSLVDRNRQWFKSRWGQEAQETSRDIAFCAHAILDQEAMIVRDTLLDPRFADNPAVVGEPRVRFYAGCPLTLPNGSRVGTLCVVDVRPRDLSDKKVGLLRELAGWVREELIRGSGATTSG